MIALFKQKSPANVVILLIFGLLIKMPLFLHPEVIKTGPKDEKLYEFVVSLLDRSPVGNGFAASILCFLLLYTQALMINYLINEQRMTLRQSYLPAMSFLLITSLFPEWNFLSSPLMASFFIVLSFILLFRLYNVAVASGAIFNIGLLLGIASFIYFPSIAYTLCIFLGLMILRPFRFNEFILLILGILTPYYFLAVYQYLTDHLTLQSILPNTMFHISPIPANLWIAVAVVLIGIPFLAGGYFIQAQLRKMLIQVRKNWSILLLYLLISLIIPLGGGSDSLQHWVIAAAPFAAFHACAYLYPTKILVPSILFFATVVFIFFKQYGAPLWQL
ncbi:MAG TPA: hypothetical protein VM935_19635 [Chitinophagaceae bacterium]|nr:hypothetical protein [Chitinophagaceae bacterium]